MKHRREKRHPQKHSRKRIPSQKENHIRVLMPRPETNEREQIIIVPEFSPNDPRALIPRSPEGGQGIYTVTFFLSIPGKEHFRDEIDLNKFRQSGNSLLLVPEEATKVNVTAFNDQEAVIVTLSKNTHGALSTAQLRVQASNFVEAETNAFNIVLPLLSRWSYLYDVALDIAGYQVLEERTDTQKWTLGLLGKEKVLNFHRADVSKPMYRTVFSAYREALNATNPFYQLLCFYKVIEGVKKLRTIRKEAILHAGNEYREPSDESMPDRASDCGTPDSLILEYFKPYLGRKFTWVLEQMRGLLRNAVAHLNPEGDTFVADSFEDIAKCERAIPVIKYISRMMLRNELQADPDYSKAPIS